MIISVVVTAFFLSLLSCASAAEGSHCVRCPGEDRGKQKLSTSSTDDTNIYCVYGKELCGYYLATREFNAPVSNNANECPDQANWICH